MTSPLKILLVDDERLARKRLRGMLEMHEGVVVVGEADGVADAAAAVEDLHPDAIFLDVEMPPGNGFDLVALLPGAPFTPDIVFVTAHETFAVSAFAVNAADYLLKPIHPERLAAAIAKLRKAKGSRTPLENADELWTLRTRISLTDGRKQCVAEVREIAAIRALGSYSMVCLRLRPSVMVLRGISEWEKRLPSEAFSRLDRSLIVQPKLLRSTEKISRDETLVTLDGVPVFSIGRAAAIRLRRHRDCGC